VKLRKLSEALSMPTMQTYMLWQIVFWHIQHSFRKYYTVFSKQIKAEPCISSKRSFAYHPQFIAAYHQATGKYTLKRDEIQGRHAALDDMLRTSRGDDMPSLWLG